MGWNLTSAAAGGARALGLRRRWFAPALGSSGTDGSAPRTAPPAHSRATVYERVAARTAASMPAPDDRAVAGAYAVMGENTAVVDRAVASGAPVEAVVALAARWTSMTRDERRLVATPVVPGKPGPVMLLDVPARQIDQTTCGAASLAMMYLLADPFLVVWLATGQPVGGYLAPSSRAAVRDGGPISTVAERWVALQRVLHREVRARAVGPFPWPQFWGSPPWRIRHVARVAGVSFQGRLIDDRAPGEVAGFLAHARAALQDGIPVPLFVGADSSQGLSGVVPRHVVLLVGEHDGGFSVYEPGSGRVEIMADEAFLRAAHHGVRHPGWGHWWRLTWALVPRPRRLRP